MKISDLKILLKKMVEKYCQLKSLLYICCIETKKKSNYENRNHTNTRHQRYKNE